MEIIIIATLVLLGLALTIFLTPRGKTDPENHRSRRTPQSDLGAGEQSGTSLSAREQSDKPHKPLESGISNRTDGIEVMGFIFDVQEKTLRELRETIERLLPEVEADSEDYEYLKEILEVVTNGMESVTINRNELESLQQSIPAGQVAIMPNFYETMNNMLNTWFGEMFQQWEFIPLAVKYIDKLPEEKQGAETARQVLDSVITALRLMEQIKMPVPGLTVEETTESIAAYMIDIIASDGKISEEEVTFLNHVLSREWSSEQYFSHYSDRMGTDKAADELMAVIEQMSEHSSRISSFVNRALNPILTNAITADGIVDEKEIEKLNVINRMLQERMGATGELPNAAVYG